MPARRMLRRVVQGTVALLVLGTAVIGFAHTKPGRPILKLLGMGKSAGGCPFGYDKPATAEARDKARLHFAKVHRGATRAADRPALGFALDTTSRADVVAWSAAHGVACAPGKTADLACSEVAAAAPLPGRRPAGPRYMVHL